MGFDVRRGTRLWRRVGAGAVALLACLGAVEAWATEVTLIADAHINSAMPAVNSGAISNLNVGGGYTALLQFDLSLLPAGTTSAKVSRAVLRLYANRVTTPGIVSLAPVTAAWGEYSVTFANQPATGGAAQLVSVSQAGAFIAIDVTTLVQGWISDPATNDGVALSAGTAVVQFDSKENDQTAHAATLDIELVDAGPQGVTGALGAIGPVGPQGIPGAAGAPGSAGSSGPAGPVGLTGLRGLIGPTGPAGPAGAFTGGGLNYQGTYASTTNYALGDVAVFEGSSYTSLVASSHGNTPSLNPMQWGLLASAGVSGAAGATGPTAPAGLTGATGPAGQPGSPGAIGATGLQGVPGLNYQGIYASSTNYALGDVVLWQGASYTSLSAGNHGNTPSFSPQQWGVLSAQGPAGSTGAVGAAGPTGPQGLPGSVGPNGPIGPQGWQGIAGQAGAQGIPGATGTTGLSGPMGPQGIAGPVGLSFQGAYVSTSNYALADGISYKGAGYVSLVGQNRGNTPDQSPQQWVLFAAAGGTGAIGRDGATGATGAFGAAGPQGLPGIPGATGSAGAQGPPVANYLGNYQSSASYAPNDAVSWQGSTYISLGAGNLGNTPSLSPQQWTVLAAQGIAGTVGAPGPTGSAGSPGAAGASGATGPQGPPVTFLGGWLAGTSYAVGDTVAYGGSSFIALAANAAREPNFSPQYWSVLAAGVVGPAGPAGATGLQGPTGYSGPAGIAGSQGATGATGATGSVGLIYQGTYALSTNYGLNDAVTWQGSSYISLAAANSGNRPDLNPFFWSLLAVQGTAGSTGATGPQGLAGLPGATGPQGLQGSIGAAGTTGMIFRGAWNIVTGYATNDAVTFGGSTYIAMASSSSSQPNLVPQAWALLAQSGSTGPAGPTGASGAAASITLGTTTTGAAGTPVVVTDSGTASAAVLNFTIPQGAAGAAGGGGSGGGTLLASTYRLVPTAAYSNYYSVNNANTNSTDAANVLTWLPTGCTVTALSVFSQQTNTITVTLRSGIPGNMVNTALSCSAIPGGQCTSPTGGAVIPAGSFVDFIISGANPNLSSPVWTALTCK